MAQSVIGALRVMLGADTAAFEKSLKNATKSLHKVGRRMRDAGKTMSASMSVPLAGVGAAVIKMAGDFEAGMNKVQAVLRPTEKEFKQLRDLAAELGRTTQFSASQAADGLEMLARNGLNATQILNGAADATLKLAAAAGAELAPSADVVTDLMVNFEKEGEDLAQVVDQISGSLASSKLGFDDYRQAIGQAAGTAGPLGMTLEDMNAALALTAPSFASGSEAGTSFKGMLLRLNPQSKKAADIMKEHNLQFFDAQGNMKSLAQIAQVLQDRLGDLTPEEQADILKQLFGQRTVRSAIRLMEEGAEGVRRVKEQIAGVSAEQMAEARLQGFSGAMKQLKSAAEGLAIAVADSGLLQWVTDFVKGLTEVVRSLAETNPAILRWGTIIAGVAMALGPVIFSLGLLASGIGALLPVLGALKVALLAIVGPTNPLGMLLTAVTAIVLAWQNWDTIAPIIKNVYTAVKTWLVDKLNAAWEWVKSGIASVQKKFQWLYNTVVGNSIIPDLVTDVGSWLGRMSGDMNDSFSGMSSVMGRFSHMASSALSGLVRGTTTARDAVSRLADSLSRMLLNKAFQTLVGGLFGGGGGGTWLGGDIINPATLPGFARGGSFKVGGSGGLDSQLAMMRVTPGETVQVNKPGEEGGGGSENIHVTVGVDVDNSGNLMPFVTSVTREGMDRVRSEIPETAISAVSKERTVRPSRFSDR